MEKEKAAREGGFFLPKIILTFLFQYGNIMTNMYIDWRGQRFQREPWYTKRSLLAKAEELVGWLVSHINWADVRYYVFSFMVGIALLWAVIVAVRVAAVTSGHRVARIKILDWPLEWIVKNPKK